jgi:Crp-like helix-turn-helix domain
LLPRRCGFDRTSPLGPSTASRCTIASPRGLRTATLIGFSRVESTQSRPLTSDQVEQLILQDLPGRLASALLGLTEKRKLDAETSTIAITQQEIGEMVGMTRESINKQLRAWALRKWVRLEHGAIVVLDAAALRDAEAGTRGGV